MSPEESLKWKKETKISFDQA